MEHMSLSKEPMDSFESWWQQVATSAQLEHAACCVSTAGQDLQPHSRMVLLRGHGPEGFYFFTNYNSQKSKQLFENPKVALNFHWNLPVHRQVRVEGVAEKASTQVSDAYFSSRARESQISAWLSPQSEVLDSLSDLEAEREKLEQKFAGGSVPRPSFWGGFLVRPAVLEFWQEEKFRFHNRLRYRRSGAGWVIEQLAP